MKNPIDVAAMRKERNGDLTKMKSDSHLDVGDALGKSHTIQRFEYTNVHAPAGVK